MNQHKIIPLLLAVLVIGSPVSFAQGPANAPAPVPAVPPLVLVQTIPLSQVKGGFNHHSADGKSRRVFLCASGNRSVEVSTSFPVKS